MKVNVNEKKILLTGASRGLGALMARALARKGAELVISARNKSKSELKKIADEFPDQRIHICTADVGKPVDCEKLFQFAQKKMGQVDILINNAALDYLGPYAEADMKRVNSILDVNLRGPMYLTRMALPEMIARNDGHIINVSSLSAKAPYYYNSLYSTSKFALTGWTRCLRGELQENNVQVSALMPGYISDVGLHAIHGRKSPVLAREVNPQKVVAKTMDMIEKRKKDIVVTGGPVKPLLLFMELFPGSTEWVYRITGLTSFMKKMANIG